MGRIQIVGADFDAKETLIVGSTVVGFTADTIGKNRDRALVTVENAAVRFWSNGSIPAANEGHVLEPGDTLTLDRQQQLQRVRFVRRDTEDATLQCSFGI